MQVPDATWVESHYQTQIEDQIPYWTKPWPATFALCAWIASHPTRFADRTWLEVGAGLGLPSLLLSQLGATTYCSDYNHHALRFLWNNITYYHLRNIIPLELDWQIHQNIPPVDGILLADVNYEPATSRVLLDRIKQWLENGLSIFLTTPHRLAGRPFIEQLLKLGFEAIPLEPHLYAPHVPCTLYRYDQA